MTPRKQPAMNDTTPTGTVEAPTTTAAAPAPPVSVLVRAILPVAGITPGETGTVDPTDPEIAALIANQVLIPVD